VVNGPAVAINTPAKRDLRFYTPAAGARFFFVTVVTRVITAITRRARGKYLLTARVRVSARPTKRSGDGKKREKRRRR